MVLTGPVAQSPLSPAARYTSANSCFSQLVVPWFGSALRELGGTHVNRQRHAYMQVIMAASEAEPRAGAWK